MMIRSLTALAAAALLGTAANAADFAFNGIFAQDSSKVAFTFTLANMGTVSLRSLGYAGGTNLNGDTVAAGGFDSVLSLYDGTGLLIDENDDVGGTFGDAALSLALGAGGYTVFLTQYNNFGPIQLPGAFGFDGQPNFRSGFIDFNGNRRTGAWALGIAGVDGVAAASVPEPGVWALMIVGFGLVGAAIRRRQLDVVAA